MYELKYYSTTTMVPSYNVFSKGGVIKNEGRNSPSGSVGDGESSDRSYFNVLLYPASPLPSTPEVLKSPGSSPNTSVRLRQDTKRVTQNNSPTSVIDSKHSAELSGIPVEAYYPEPVRVVRKKTAPVLKYPHRSLQISHGLTYEQEFAASRSGSFCAEDLQPTLWRKFKSMFKLKQSQQTMTRKRKWRHSSSPGMSVNNNLISEELSSQKKIFSVDNNDGHIQNPLVLFTGESRQRNLARNIFSEPSRIVLLLDDVHNQSRMVKTVFGREQKIVAVDANGNPEYDMDDIKISDDKTHEKLSGFSKSNQNHMGNGPINGKLCPANRLVIVKKTWDENAGHHSSALVKKAPGDHCAVEFEKSAITAGVNGSELKLPPLQYQSRDGAMGGNRSHHETNVSCETSFNKSSAVDVPSFDSICGTTPDQQRSDIGLTRMFNFTGHTNKIKVAVHQLQSSSQFVNSRGGSPKYVNVHRERAGQEGMPLSHIPYRELYRRRSEGIVIDAYWKTVRFASNNDTKKITQGDEHWRQDSHRRSSIKDSTRNRLCVDTYLKSLPSLYKKGLLKASAKIDENGNEYIIIGGGDRRGGKSWENSRGKRDFIQENMCQAMRWQPKKPYSPKYVDDRFGNHRSRTINYMHKRNFGKTPSYIRQWKGYT